MQQLLMMSESLFEKKTIWEEGFSTSTIGNYTNYIKMRFTKFQQKMTYLKLPDEKISPETWMICKTFGNLPNLQDNRKTPIGFYVFIFREVLYMKKEKVDFTAEIFLWNSILLKVIENLSITISVIFQWEIHHSVSSRKSFSSVKSKDPFSYTYLSTIVLQNNRDKKISADAYGCWNTWLIGKKSI